MSFLRYLVNGVDSLRLFILVVETMVIGGGCMNGIQKEVNLFSLKTPARRPTGVR